MKNDVVGSVDELRQVSQTNQNPAGLPLALYGGPYRTGRCHDTDRFFSLDGLLNATDVLNGFEAVSKLRDLPTLLQGGEYELHYRDWWEHLSSGQCQLWSGVLQLLNLRANRNAPPFSIHNHSPVVEAVELMPLASLKQRWRIDYGLCNKLSS